jgi:hypothetical protein
MRNKISYLLGAGCLFLIASLAIFALSSHINHFIVGREEYNSFIPFVIAFFPASISLCFFMIPHIGGWLKALLIGFVVMICVAPIPFGPEGGFMPMPLSLLGCFLSSSVISQVFEYWQGPAYTFLIFFCGSWCICLLFTVFKPQRTCIPEQYFSSLQEEPGNK